MQADFGSIISIRAILCFQISVIYTSVANGLTDGACRALKCIPDLLTKGSAGEVLANCDTNDHPLMCHACHTQISCLWCHRWQETDLLIP